MVIAAVVLFLVFSGALQPKSSSQTVSEQPNTQAIPTRTPKDIGLTMQARPDMKAVMFTISKTSGLQSVDYELTYTAEGNQNRGIIGTIVIKPEDSTVTSKYLDLGTCSSGVCKFDKGVKKVNLQLAVTKTDGTKFQVNDSLSLQ